MKLYVELAFFGLSAYLVHGCSPFASNTVTSGSKTYVCLVLSPLNWVTNTIDTPTSAPFITTSMPSSNATSSPSTIPSSSPSASPSSSDYPTIPFNISDTPTEVPSLIPSAIPSAPSTTAPSSAPTASPSAAPTYTLGQYRRVVGVFNADSTSRFAVKNSWTSQYYESDNALQMLNVSSSPGGGFAVSVESNGVISYQKAFRTQRYDNGTALFGVTYPLLMAIVHVSAGAVTGITWDDTCKWCDATSCAENTFNYHGVAVTSDGGGNCWVRDSACSVSTNGTSVKSSCQLNVYVVWTGTDSSGAYLQSATTRFSRLSSSQLIEFTNSF